MFGFLIKELAVAVLGGLLVYTVVKVTREAIVNKVKETYAAAFKAKIKEKKQNAVKVGIFGENDYHMGDFEIKGGNKNDKN